MRTWFNILVVFALVGSPVFANGKLAAPEGEVLLVVDGAISNINCHEAARLDLEILQSLPVQDIVTHTPWEKGLQRFSGVRVSDLLAFLGADSSDFLAVGFDGYKVEFTDVDLERYPVIVAWEHNGAPFSLRQLGPLRIMFPFDDHPELLTRHNEAIAVWQLVQMTVR